MPIAAVLDFPGASLDQYDQVISLMGFEPGGSGPPGEIFHWVTQTDGGIRVTDVWETREQYEQFVDEQIGPYTRQVGITAAPRITYYDVHNYLTAG